MIDLEKAGISTFLGHPTKSGIMVGREGRMLFCAMSGIQRHTAPPVAIITEFTDEPF
jgi:hypothetical protein